ncbi:hypothetical protein POF45_00375 [Pseudomonas sp. 681]|uniref:Uncharacterized protein n=1 Tax=Pseudomonas fungipugnans TaxID=3024217 RepID=A0ABT6QGF2_9PSED|nr:hypothetical protein [Pseudomonas sp. 681]MDI2589888.1 hypothetical protein [Pseudomonas sp. 681]
MLDSIFKSATSPGPVGRVQALSLGRECVPFVADGAKFLIEFVAPPFLRGETFFQEMLYIDQEGDYFIPKLDHRRISVWTGPDAEGEWSEASSLDAGFQTLEFARLFQRAVFAYFHSSPNIDQYFFEASEQFGSFVQEKALLADEHLNARCAVTIFKQIAAPFYGFTLNHIL